MGSWKFSSSEPQGSILNEFHIKLFQIEKVSGLDHFPEEISVTMKG